MKYLTECSNTVVSILGKSSMMRVINLYGPFYANGKVFIIFQLTMRI